jgi:hypothetical protein
MVVATEGNVMKNLDLESEIYGNADDSSISQQGDERLRFSLNKLRAVSYDTEVGFLAPSRHRSFPLETCTSTVLTALMVFLFSSFPQEPCRCFDSAAWLGLAPSVAVLLL